jgi:hypothetical protein
VELRQQEAKAREIVVWAAADEQAATQAKTINAAASERASSLGSNAKRALLLVNPFSGTRY